MQETSKVTILKLDASIPSVIYRFLDKPKHVEDLIRGEVWISTLERCRKYEGARGDSDEGSVDYQSGTIIADGDDDTLQLMAKRSGISIGKDVKSILFSNNSSSVSIPDAWVFCTTERCATERLRQFGSYGVRINEPIRFCEAVTARISAQHEVTAMVGRIRYRERFYKATDPEPGPLGFVKPPDKYADEVEFRMLWKPEWKLTSPLEPMTVNCPEIRTLVSRL